MKKNCTPTWSVAHTNGRHFYFLELKDDNTVIDDGNCCQIKYSNLGRSVAMIGDHIVIILIILCLIFCFDSQKPYPKNIFCEFRWACKTLNVLNSYKRCTSWLELETCCADLEPFIITLRLLETYFVLSITQITYMFGIVMQIVFKIIFLF
jgi:hypothetical protein